MSFSSLQNRASLGTIQGLDLSNVMDGLINQANTNKNAAVLLDASHLSGTQVYDSPAPPPQKTLTPYTETLRAPTDYERQVLRSALLEPGENKPSWVQSSAEQYVNKKGEETFGRLSADVLKQTINEYKTALKKEQTFSMLQGMGMSDITDFKENIKNSILGDSGFGGFVGFGKGSEQEETLSKTLDKALGIGPSVEYNWQKWFDETISERYQDLETLKKIEGSDISPEETERLAELQELGRAFVQDYLKPRFDTSKSISEFISYMDVKVEEQNVLQTQLASSALKDYAEKQARAFIDSLGTNSVTREFDPKFYRNPSLVTDTDQAEKKKLYERQKNELASLNPDEVVEKENKTWKQLAYEYGLDIVNNPDDFSRLHYEIVGREKGYDPVADTYTGADLDAFIKTDLAKSLETQKGTYVNSVFTPFVSADAKANELVQKLNLDSLPAEYKERLRDLGVSEKDDPADQVKDALAQILRTDPALEIRAKIDQLNEERIKPTQKELGFGYIQRESDEEIKPQTGGSALFSVFKKAGYTGTESEFYTDFFPDATEEDKSLDYSSKQVKAKGGVQDLLGFSMPDFSDPFAAMGSLDQMLGDDTTKKKETYTPKRSTFFDYFPDEEDEGAPSYFNMGSGGGFGSLFG
jgi:hypothetical protein